MRLHLFTLALGLVGCRADCPTWDELKVVHMSGEATEAELPSYRAKVPAPTMHQRKRKEQGFFSSCDIPMLSTHSVSLSVQDGLTNAVVESVKL